MERVETLTNAVNGLQHEPVHVPAESVQPDGNYTDDTQAPRETQTQAPRETQTQAPRETQAQLDLHDVSLDDVLNSITAASNSEEAITESNVQEVQIDTNHSPSPNTTDRHTVDTGLLAQSLGTDVTPILRPPGVGLEFSVNGMGLAKQLLLGCRC